MLVEFTSLPPDSHVLPSDPYDLLFVSVLVLSPSILSVVSPLPVSAGLKALPKSHLEQMHAVTVYLAVCGGCHAAVML